MSVVLLPLAAGIGGDAGTGGDASDVRAAPTLLPGYGSYAGALDEGDLDWYRVDDGVGGLACARGTVSPSRSATAALGVVASGGNRTAVVAAPADATTAIAIASSAHEATVLGVGPALSASDASYGFSIAAATAVPATLPDPTATGGALAPGDCAQGDLISILNGADAYRVPLRAGDLVWYSLAATGPATLSLLDPQGAAVGPAIVGDQLAGAIVPATGEYTLGVALDGIHAGRLSYLVGVATAAEPPTNPCRPYCVALG